MSEQTDMMTRLEDILRQAKAKGATDVYLTSSKSDGTSVGISDGKKEALDRSLNISTNITVFVGNKSASTSVKSARMSHMQMALDGVMEAVKLSSDNPYAGLADPSQIQTSYPMPDIYDSTAPSVEELFEMAAAAEEAALSGEKIDHSKGASANMYVADGYVLASNGFNAQTKRSGFGLGVSVVAKSENGMEVDGGYSSKVYFDDLRDPAVVGQEAAQRAAEKLDARSVASGEYPIVFDKRVSGRLVSEFMNAIHGKSIAKGQSFLKDAMNKQVMPEGVSITENPLLDRLAASRPFDLEGIASRDKTFVEDGVLQSWILDLESARELGLETTGNSGGVTNISLRGNEVPLEDILADIKDGFLVTGLMGRGANTITGDFSLAANGLWIQNGKVGFAVSGVTLAGQMIDMLKNLTLADDIEEEKAGTRAPSLLVNGMTLAGR